ncbi:ATP-grasp domain-containing protein [Halomonas sp. YLGW01]|uniref:ATP-grasp domain-containing protein n=1 Tax=Halomonas sp. YLGW01 TaxID=2773308 RepID=UPI00177E793D|nr:ATP-grasp domain-containing protein [Halomonas sp. YLGW01]
MNVLLTCVGRRSYLVDYFRQALAGEGVVIGVDMDPNTAGMACVDKAYLVPRADSGDYIPTLLDICMRERVGLLVSLSDLDLGPLSRAIEDFGRFGVQAFVSDPEVIEVANDKWACFEFLQRHRIPSPVTCLQLDKAQHHLRDGHLAFPLMVKPRWGMGSVSLFKVNDDEELAFFYHYARKQVRDSFLHVISQDDIDHSVIIQEFLGGDEYGIDVLHDFDGEHVATVVKRKLSMRAGETDSAMTVEDRGVANTAERVAALLRHRGNLDIDIMLDAAGLPRVLELNARFGGGYPFSHLAGVDFPRALIELAEGRRPAPYLLRPSVGVRSMKHIVPTVYSPLRSEKTIEVRYPS